MLSLTEGPIDIAAVRRAVEQPGYGAVLLFLGTARDHFEGRPVVELRYEAYPAMAIPELERIAAEVAERWPGVATAVVHRTGVVPVTEPTVVIATGAPHRAEAYEANRYTLEQLKARVPVWKKEVYADGSAWKANAPTRGA